MSAGTTNRLTPSFPEVPAARVRRVDVEVVGGTLAERGLGRDLARVASQRIVYVSCDPATLARDLEVLLDGGFRVESARVFDLMPMTAEVETVVTLLATGGRSA